MCRRRLLPGLTPWRFRVVLVTAFFFMAALHVIHQGGYVADSYRDKRPEPYGLAGFSRGIDYGLLAASLFVLATFKFTGASLRLYGMDLSQHPFTTGGRQLLFPSVVRDEVFAGLALTAFALCVAAFLIKCGYEVAGRRLTCRRPCTCPWPPACSSSPRRCRIEMVPKNWTGA